MKIACLGGGPAGLYFAISMKLRDAAHDITVFERNKPDDTFGWGVVLSNETFENLAKNDSLSAGEIRRHFAYWDDIAVHYRGQKIVSTGHGFSGIARKKLLATVATARPRARHRAAFRDRDRQRRGTGQDPRSGRRRGRVEFKDAQRIRRPLQARHRDPQEQIRLARHPPKIRRRLHLHLRGNRARLDLGARLPVRCRHRDFHRRMRRRYLAKIRLRRHEPGGELPRLREDFRKVSRRPPADVERGACARLGMAEFPARAVRDVVVRKYRADGRRRRDRAFLRRLRHQARHGERHRHGELSAQRADHGGGVCEIRGCAAHRSSPFAKRGAQFAGMVRGRRALPASRSGAVQLFAIDALAAHQPREFAAARQEVARRRRSLVPAPRRRRRQHGAPADVRAVPAARHAAEKPDRGVADGAIQSDRRLPDRLAPRALRRARQGRRRSRLHRDDLRQPGRPHHARLHRDVCAGARGGVEAHRRFRPRRDRRKNLLPARPFRRQGLDATRLGGDGRAAAIRQLAGAGAVGRSPGRRATRSPTP